ncbi:hypothetical protein [Streptomyces virginiae]|uniref:hypothetical protein n=1 Tax=Streptomyces virginiae TaxID=1961 RepID=UPI002DB8C45D|nr:hypothetical protein [Streptomyces sp. CMAA1738]MEC4575787.1 hypothetical protein [Streptomyces sp. CMAA1738]
MRPDEDNATSAGPAPEARHALGLFLLVTAVSLLIPIAPAGEGKRPAASAVVGRAALRPALAGIQQLTRLPTPARAPLL